jgi:hypothetical protein
MRCPKFGCVAGLAFQGMELFGTAHFIQPFQEFPAGDFSPNKNTLRGSVSMLSVTNGVKCLFVYGVPCPVF